MKRGLIAAALIAALPAAALADDCMLRVSAVDLAPGVAAFSTLDSISLGKLNRLPPPAPVQHSFGLTSTIRPLMSAGVNCARFYNVDLATGLSVDKNSFGGALQADVGIAATQNGHINFDVKKIRIGANVKRDDANTVNQGITPMV